MQSLVTALRLIQGCRAWPSVCSSPRSGYPLRSRDAQLSRCCGGAGHHMESPLTRIPSSRRLHMSSTRGMRLSASSKETAAPGPGSGKCWLVGAGPGAPDLLTLRAARVLGEADVVIFDDLGAKDLMDEFIPREAARMYVGKRGGRASITQQEISAMLVEQCQKGLNIVRLKGGCPSMLARCSDELRALQAAGIEVEIVPGVSSALAAPLLAGFPLTDRDVGRTVTITSAHDLETLDWDALVRMDTLVLLMGGASIQKIVDKLMLKGRESNTPVAVIRAASTDEQRSWFGCLGDICSLTAGTKLSPCVIVVGEVVNIASV